MRPCRLDLPNHLIISLMELKGISRLTTPIGDALSDVAFFAVRSRMGI
jgi:hypothetical protein